MATGPLAATAANASMPNRTDFFTRIISASTGFVDGSFKAKNISLCRMNLITFANIMQNLSKAVSDGNENRTLYYSTRALKYMHPCLFHCYYAERETEATYHQYLQINSA